MGSKVYKGNAKPVFKYSNRGPAESALSGVKQASGVVSAARRRLSNYQNPGTAKVNMQNKGLSPMNGKSAGSMVTPGQNTGVFSKFVVENSKYKRA